MKTVLKKLIVDTNVAITANLATKPDEDTDTTDFCIDECIRVIDQVTRSGGLVLDEDGEIYDEYMDNLSLKTAEQHHIGNAFLKWVHNNQWKPELVDRVKITRDGSTYLEFPDHEDLVSFDLSDRKFVATANAHPEKPPIVQATDSKWWGWKDALSAVDISVHILDPNYLEAKYHEKMGA